MNFVQIFIITVPVVIIYICQFIAFLRNNLGKTTFSPILEVYLYCISIVYLFNQLLFLELYLDLYLCNERKTCFFKLSFLVASKASQNLNIS